MIETIFSLLIFGSIVWTIILSSLFLIACIYFEVKESFVGLVWFTFIFIGVSYLWGNLTIQNFIANFNITTIAGYILIGLLYSFIRVFFYGRYKQKTHLESTYNTGKYVDKSYIYIKENVFRWWLFWPISILVWFLKDATKEIYNFVYSKIEKIFNVFLELGIKSMQAKEVKDEKSNN